MIIVAVSILLALLAGSIYAIRLSHLEDQAEQRKFLDRIVQASEPRAVEFAGSERVRPESEGAVNGVSRSR